MKLKGVILAAVGAHFVAAPLEAQTSPSAVSLYAPAPSLFDPDLGSLNVGEVRSASKGDSLFRFHLRAPQRAQIVSSENLVLAGRDWPMAAATILEPFVPTNGESQDAGLPINVFCSPLGSLWSKMAHEIVKPQGGRDARLCLIDSNRDGSFDQTVLDATFYTGLGNPATKRPLSIKAVAYSMVPSSTDAYNGEIEYFFRELPVRDDRIMIGVRYRGSGSVGNLARFVVESPWGNIGYKYNYLFLTYPKMDNVSIWFLGAQIKFENFDRLNGIARFKIERAGSVKGFPVRYDAKWALDYHDFESVEFQPLR